MKKQATIGLAFALAGAMCFCLTACTILSPESSSPYGHTHSYTEWRHDDESHWLVCPTDGEISPNGKSGHNFIGGVCECGATEAPFEGGDETPEEGENSHTHTWSSVWSSNANGHFHYAICKGHENVIDEVLPHSFSNGVCTVCNYKDPNYKPTQKASEGLKYESDGKGGYICAGKGSCTDRDIVIPSEYNGLPVTSVGGFNMAEIDSVVISEGVTKIGQGAFYYCMNLTKVVIPASVTQIGVSAFKGCGGFFGNPRVTFVEPNGWQVTKNQGYPVAVTGLDDEKTAGTLLMKNYVDYEWERI